METCNHPNAYEIDDDWMFCENCGKAFRINIITPEMIQEAIASEATKVVKYPILRRE